MAMAAGVPVIASKTGGIPEIIRHEENGLLVDTEPDAVAAAVRRLQGDPALAGRLAARGRETVTEKFSIDIMVRRYFGCLPQGAGMLEAFFAFAFGLLIGSFLNVCVYRLPRDLSVVRPRSYCPACEHPIAWYDNVPLVSYAILRGACRHCKAGIPARYPIVEVLTGVLFFVYVLRMGPTPAAAKYCLLGALLVGLLFSDLEERILPDEFTLGGTVAGLALSFFIPVQDITAHAIFWLLSIDAEASGCSRLPSRYAARCCRRFSCGWAGICTRKCASAKVWDSATSR